MDISLNIRKRSFSGQYDVNKCVICQENKTDALEHKKQRGIQTLKERVSQRQKIRDVQYYEAIEFHTSDEVLCHRKCYSEFTHQKQIKTFDARAEGQNVDVESPKQEHGVTCSDSMAPSTSKCSSRRSVKPVDWNLCIFCQISNKDKLFNISTFSVSNKILQDSKLEITMRLRLAGVKDLIVQKENIITNASMRSNMIHRKRKRNVKQ
jgi:hypothetical protein